MLGHDHSVDVIQADAEDEITVPLESEAVPEHRGLMWGDEFVCQYATDAVLHVSTGHLSPQAYAGLPDATGEEAVCVRCGKTFVLGL